MSHWTDIDDAYPDLFSEEATTQINTGPYVTPFGAPLRPVLPGMSPVEDEIDPEILRYLGLAGKSRR